jgi:hypothetical protein
MNSLSLSELCCLFCCPPCPSRIAAKLAFLPPEPTYSFIPDETGSKFSLHLTERAEWQYSQRELDCIEVFYTRTSKGNRIACMFAKCAPNAKYTPVSSGIKEYVGSGGKNASFAAIRDGHGGQQNRQQSSLNDRLFMSIY